MPTEPEKSSTSNKRLIWLLAIALAVIVFNTMQMQALKTAIANRPSVPTGQSPVAAAGDAPFPTGIPAIYGNELGVSFDAVSPATPDLADSTIQRLGQLDVDLTLNAEQKKRYINVLYTLNKGISCEYCCGARAVIFENGEAACGCAHSFAMRGLTKYLIINHGAQYTDEQLLEEAGKWKMLFFPTQMGQKAAVLKANGIEPTVMNLASNQYRGVERGQTQGGGMVGGC
ncbi:hypothetical protein J4419_03715 [Candidatus Woesearchaeota archaeon]|nr:hypothetical protein [Candidatus Woesearchaeota archaeon]